MAGVMSRVFNFGNNETSEANITKKVSHPIDINKITHGPVSFNSEGFIEVNDIVDNFLGGNVTEFLNGVIPNFSLSGTNSEFDIEAEFTDTDFDFS